MHILRLTRSAMPLLVAATLAGCGGSGLLTVTGSVQLGDAPLTTGNVTFVPVQGGPVGTATVRSDGSFTAYTASKEGLAPGEYQIAVRATGPMPDPPPGTLEAIPPLLTPEKYGSVKTSGLSCTVPCKSLELVLQED